MTTKFTYSSGINVTFTGTQISSTSYSGFPIAVEIASNVTTICPNAFKDISLNSVTFIDESTSVLQSIGAHAFENTKITFMDIPNSVSIIGEYCFTNCKYLDYINIIDGSNLRNIGSHAFYNSPNFKSIIIPNSVMNIGEYCFANTDISLSTLPCSLSVIPAHAFENAKITNIKFPSSIVHIDDYAFANNNLLSSVTFTGSKLQIIGAYAFKNSVLTTLNIPLSVSDIGDHAFDSVINHDEFNAYNNEKAIYDNNLDIYNTYLSDVSAYEVYLNDLSDYNVYVNAVEAYDEYLNDLSIYEIYLNHKSLWDAAENTSIGSGGNPPDVVIEPAIVIEPDVVVVEPAIVTAPTTIVTAPVEPAIVTLTSLDVIIPVSSRLKTIGDYAFYNNNLTKIYLPLTLTSIGDHAFANNNFTSKAIVLDGNNLKTIGDYAFANNIFIDAINIPHSVTSIGPSAFTNVHADLEVTFTNPNTSLVINNGTFGPTQLPAVFSIINFVRHNNS